MEFGQFWHPHLLVHWWLELGLLSKEQMVLEIEELLQTSPSVGKEHLKAKLFFFGGGGKWCDFSSSWVSAQLWGLKLSWVNVTSWKTCNGNFSLPHIPRVWTRLQMPIPLSWRRKKGNWGNLTGFISFFFTGSGVKPFKCNWSSWWCCRKLKWSLSNWPDSAWNCG